MVSRSTDQESLTMIFLVSVSIAATAATTTPEGPEGLVVSRHRRVVGGSPVEPGKWPWMAQVGVYNVKTVLHVFPEAFEVRYCGGVVISRTWVLTSAHCIRDHSEVKNTIDVNTVKVTVGSLTFLPYDSEQVFTELLSVVKQVPVYKRYRESWGLYNKSFDVQQIVIPQDYLLQSNSIHHHNDDVALLQLAEAVPTMQHAILQEDDLFPAATSKCCALGWGCIDSSASGKSAPVLQEVEMPILNNAECSYWLGVNMDDKICAGHVGSSKGLCKGDSGGPLVCQRADGDWRLVGLVSVGQTIMPDQAPVAFTKISYHSQWIRQVMKAQSTNN